MTTIQAYKVMGNKHYFRDGKKKMVIERFKKGHYIVTGDIIEGKEIMLFSDETIRYQNIVIEVK